MRPVHGYAAFLLIRAAFGAIFMPLDGKSICKMHETPKKSHQLRLPWQKLWSFMACVQKLRCFMSKSVLDVPCSEVTRMMRWVHGYAAFLFIRSDVGVIFMPLDGKSTCKMHETPKKSHQLRLPWHKNYGVSKCVCKNCGVSCPKVPRADDEPKRFRNRV